MSKQLYTVFISLIFFGLSFPSIIVFQNSTPYLLHEGIIREIPNNFTLKRLGNFENISDISLDIYKNLKIGPKIPSLGPPHDVDEAMAYELTKFGVFQKNMIKSTIMIGKLCPFHI
jgi:hypothetical protein